MILVFHDTGLIFIEIARIELVRPGPDCGLGCGIFLLDSRSFPSEDKFGLYMSHVREKHFAATSITSISHTHSHLFLGYLMFSSPHVNHNFLSHTAASSSLYIYLNTGL